MNTFNLSIRSSDRTVYEGEAATCVVTTPSGKIGFEARHEKFLAVLEPDSEIRYRDADGIESTLEVRSGLLSFNDNACTVVFE